MSPLNIPTLQDMQATRRATPKYELPSKTEKARAKQKADKDDEQKLAAWGKAVKNRDEWTDRYTGKRLKRTKGLSFDPDAAHAHHVEPRENWDTRHDVRNGITLSFETHEKVEKNQLRIVGTKFFTVNGKRYVDCTHRVRFAKVP